MTGSRIRVWGVAAVAVVVALTALYVADAHPRGADQPPFSRHHLTVRVPVERTATYRLNGRVRPMLFWIGRDDIGEAAVTWRRQLDGRRALEFVVGSDPARAPRHLNRWGYIVEEFDSHGATVFGLMKESNERTLQEAEANVKRHERISVFKAARTTVVGQQVEAATMTIKAPSEVSYKNLDEVLAIVPSETSPVRRATVPAGTHPGFLVALEAMIRASVTPCQASSEVRENTVAPATYVYNQTVYDLTMVSCELEPELRLPSGVTEQAIDARFRLRNRTTKHDTRFRLMYGTSSKLREVPLRAVFRPQWWMEVELELTGEPGPSDASRPKEGP